MVYIFNYNSDVINQTLIAKTLNLDIHPNLHKEEDLPYLLNGDISDYSHVGNSAFVQNVLSNELCYKFPTGYKFLGAIKLDSDEYVTYFKTPTSSEIGILKDCKYTVKINNPCLKLEGQVFGVYNFTEGCKSRRVYWVDGSNPNRYLDIDLPLPTINKNQCDSCEEDLKFDCSLLDFNKLVTIPKLVFKQTTGKLKEGAYQIAIAFGDAYSRITEYHVYPSTEYIKEQGGLSVTLDCIKNFSHYHISLIKQGASGTVVYKIGAFGYNQKQISITSENYSTISLAEIQEINTYYSNAKHITTNGERLILADLAERDTLNFQREVLKIRSQWVALQVPAEQAKYFFSFMRGEVYPFTIRYVYPDMQRTKWFHITSNSEKEIIEGIGIGKWNDLNEPITPLNTPCPTQSFQWQNDETIINPCQPTSCRKWQVNFYNSSAIYIRIKAFTDCQGIYHDTFDIGASFDGSGNKYFRQQFCIDTIADIEWETISGYPGIETTVEVEEIGECNSASTCIPLDFDCHTSVPGVSGNVDWSKVKVLSQGTFPHWESTLTYPNNPCVWGQRDSQKLFYDKYGLSCKGIRYHKFPSNKVAPHHANNLCEKQEFVNILTIKFSNIPIPEGCIGYEIGVGNRDGNESILHKGLIYNMWAESLPDCTQSLYPGYPFNDLRPDPFLGKKLVHTGDTKVNPFDDDGFEPVTMYVKDKFQYVSPDIQYEKNDKADYIQVYSEEVGDLKRNYGLIPDFPRVVYLSAVAYFIASTIALLAALAAIMVGIGTTSFGGGVEQAASVYLQVLDTIRNFSNPINYALYYFTQSNYAKSDFTRAGLKVPITHSQHLEPSRQLIRGNKINNLYRESALFVQLESEIPDPVNVEQSRFLMSDECSTSVDSCNGDLGKTSSYYVGFKVEQPAQYGMTDNFEVRVISDILNSVETQVIFGGDIKITKHKYLRKFPFFTTLPIGLPDFTRYETKPFTNISKPRFWMDIDEPEPFTNAFLTSPFLSQVGTVIDGIFVKPPFNLDKIGKFEGDTCDEDGLCTAFIGANIQAEVGNLLDAAVTDNSSYVTRQNGRFYGYVIGEAQYWCESKYVADFRTYNEVEQSNIERDRLAKVNYQSLIRPEMFLYADLLHLNISKFSSHSDPRLDCNYLTNCSNLRIIYSHKTNELSKDQWLRFSPLDYTQFSKEDGLLTTVHKVDDFNMLVVFENAIYMTQSQDGLLTTGNNEVYLGTGDPIQRRLLKLSDQYGTGGSVDKESFVNTPYGTFYFDRRHKKFFNITGKREDVTGKLQSWFNRYTPGHRMIGVYDQFSDNIYFTETGSCPWTLSFKPKANGWVSFHSFKPEYYYPIFNNFMSVTDGFWKHNKLYDYQTYYGVLYPFTIGLPISENLKPTILQSIEIYSEFNKVTDYYEVTQEDKFFNKLWITNKQYSSGLRNLVLKSSSVMSLDIDPLASQVTSLEDSIYRINNFGQQLIKQPALQWDCSGSLPALPTLSATNMTKDSLRGKYFTVFLSNDIYHEYKILVQLQTAINQDIKQ